MSSESRVMAPEGAAREGDRERVRGVRAVQYLAVAGDKQRPIEGEVVEESQVCVSVNGRELASLMCTPRDLEALVTGFLYNERVIDGYDEIRAVHVSDSDSCVDVWLRRQEFEVPVRKIVTAGCGGGVTFDDLSKKHEPLPDGQATSVTELAALMRALHMGARLYQRARGIHTAALATNGHIVSQVEDVGRHNCLDKLAGKALMEGWATRNLILLSSGRISSEMIAKARRLETAIVCSRTSPTNLSVSLADSWNITLVAYLRQNRMRVYTHPERIRVT